MCISLSVLLLDFYISFKVTMLTPATGLNNICLKMTFGCPDLKALMLYENHCGFTDQALKKSTSADCQYLQNSEFVQ